MVLDGVAAVQFLLTGQFNAFVKVLGAHREFYKSLGRLRRKREVLLPNVTHVNHPEIYKGSIIFDFFLAKKRKFSTLNFPIVGVK